MAKTLRMPSSGSILAAAASFAGYTSKAVWLGIVTGAGASGSVIFYDNSSSAAGSPFLPLIAGSRVTQIEGPFILPDGVYASPVGCCALYYRE